jgi:hypothetical protein
MRRLAPFVRVLAEDSREHVSRTEYSHSEEPLECLTESLRGGGAALRGTRRETLEGTHAASGELES